jgi:4-amino-4-deoxy-L-arabinose transferase-like glycosyltransferase
MSFIKKYWPLITIFLIGVALRFYHNIQISLWHDEAFSALFLRYPWGEMFHRLGLDVHPPMYYIFLRFWHYIFGDSLLSLRGMSIFFGSASIIAGWAFVKEAFKNEKAALWAAVFIALNPFQLQYVTEARMYTMGAFFALLGAYFLIKALRNQKQYVEDRILNMPNLPQDISLKKSFLWYYFGFAVCTGIMILTHYYLLFTAAALCFYALIYHWYHYRTQFKYYWALVASYLLIIVFFLPWLKVFMFQLSQVTAGYWIDKMNFWSIPVTLWKMLINATLDTSHLLSVDKYGYPLLNYKPNGTEVVVLLAFVFSVYFLYKFLRKTQSFEKWLVVLCVIAPFAGSLAYAGLARLRGSTSSVFLDRYFLYSSIFYTIALAVWLREIKWKWVSTILIVLYAMANLLAFSQYWKDLKVETKPGMAGASRYLAANVEPGQKVFVGTSFMFFNYKYYWSTVNPTPARPLLYTGGRNDVSQISHVEGVAILSNDDFVPDFNTAVKHGDTVWLIWTYAFGSNKPNIPKNWVELITSEYPDVRPYAGASVYVTEYKVN